MALYEIQKPVAKTYQGGEVITISDVLFCLLIALAVFSAVGCASERYLTEEQDAKFRAMCERDGCQVIPQPAWDGIEIILKHLGLLPS